MKSIFIIVLVCLAPLSCQSQPRVESIALMGLVRGLSNYPFNDEMVWRGEKFNSFFRKFKNGCFYLNDFICEVSIAYPPYFPTQIGLEQMNYSKMNEFRDSIKMDMSPKQYEIPNEFMVTTFKKFKNSGEEGDYFFIVKHYIAGIESFSVEIAVVPFGNAEYPYEYTFHVYLDQKGNLINIIDVSYDPFEFTIDCN